MKYLYVVCLMMLSSVSAIAQIDKVQWASSVVAVSSEMKSESEQAGKATQALGKPSLRFAADAHPCVWACEREGKSTEEFIVVKFDSAISANQVIINEIGRLGAIKYVKVGYTEATKIRDVTALNLRTVYQADTLKEPDTWKPFCVTISTPQEPINLVQVVLARRKDIPFSCIDAIGITNLTEPFQMTLRQAIRKEAGQAKEQLSEYISSVFGEIAPSTSPTGDSLLFTRAKHPENIQNPDKQDIWMSVRQADGSFGKPSNIGSPVNNTHHNSSFNFFAQGNKLLLNNIYKDDGTMARGLSYTRRNKNNQWEKPIAIAIDNYYNNSPYSEFYMTDDEQVLFMTVRRKDSFGDKDIYVSFRIADDHYSAPINIGKNVNTAANETSPMLAPDGRTLFFASNGHLGYGSSDIFVSYRLDDTWQNWTEPINLGEEVNSEAWDAYLTFSAATDEMFFSSYHKSKGESDIFRLKLTPEQKMLLLKPKQ